MLRTPLKKDCETIMAYINKLCPGRSDIGHVNVDWGSRGNGVTHKVNVITGASHKHRELFRSYRTRDIYAYLCGYHDRKEGL